MQSKHPCCAAINIFGFIQYNLQIIKLFCLPVTWSILKRTRTLKRNIGQNFNIQHTYYELGSSIILDLVNLLVNVLRERHETVSQCWFNVDPPSATLDQH